MAMYAGQIDDIRYMVPERWLGRKAKRSERPGTGEYPMKRVHSDLSDVLVLPPLDSERKRLFSNQSEPAGNSWLQRRNVDNLQTLEYLAHPKKRGRRGMEEKYTKVILEILSSDPEIKPEDGLLKVKEKLTLLYKDDSAKLPTDKQVKSKISNLKHQLKRSQEANFLGLENANRFIIPSQPMIPNDNNLEFLKIQECDPYNIDFADSDFLADLEDLEIPLL